MIQEYIRTAIQSWKGGMSPSEFDDLQVVAVSLKEKRITYD